MSIFNVDVERLVADAVASADHTHTSTDTSTNVPVHKCEGCTGACPGCKLGELAENAAKDPELAAKIAAQIPPEEDLNFDNILIADTPQGLEQKIAEHAELSKDALATQKDFEKLNSPENALVLKENSPVPLDIVPMQSVLPAVDVTGLPPVNDPNNLRPTLRADERVNTPPTTPAAPATTVETTVTAEPRLIKAPTEPTIVREAPLQKLAEAIRESPSTETAAQPRTITTVREAEQAESARIAARRQDEHYKEAQVVTKATQEKVEKAISREGKEGAKKIDTPKEPQLEKEKATSLAILAKQNERLKPLESRAQADTRGRSEARAQRDREGSNISKEATKREHSPEVRRDRETRSNPLRREPPTSAPRLAAPRFRSSVAATLSRTSQGRGPIASRTIARQEVKGRHSSHKRPEQVLASAVRSRNKKVEVPSVRIVAENASLRAQQAQARMAAIQSLQLRRNQPTTAQLISKRSTAVGVRANPDQIAAQRKRLVSRLPSMQELRGKVDGLTTFARKYSAIQRLQRIQSPTTLKERDLARQKVTTKREPSVQKLDKKDARDKVPRTERSKERAERHLRRAGERPQELRKVERDRRPVSREVRTVESRRLSTQRQQHLMRLKLLSEVTRHILREISGVADLQIKAKLMKSLLEQFDEERSLSSAERLNELSDLLVVLQKRRGVSNFDPRVQRLLRKVRAIQSGEASVSQGPAAESSTSKGVGSSRSSSTKAAPSKHISNEGPKTSLDIYQARIDDKRPQSADLGSE